MFARSTPEQAGVSSAAVLRFLDRLERDGLPMHAFMMVKGGRAFAEGYWKPFDENRPHRLYSCSKSFVSLAVGCLIGEGKLRLSDPVCSFFPEKLPKNPHPYLLAATVRDLLMMATPHSENASTERDPDWVAAFFQKTPSHLPGAVFSYDTAGTVVLNAIVEKLAGEPFLDYLRPRLFAPLGVSENIRCVERPEGGSWGGSGVQATLRDFAEVAFACLRGGRIDGKQLIPADYLREATTRQIDNRVGSDSPEWRFGYGYQFWVTRNGGFAFNGMGSQFAICLPDKDFLLVTQGDTQECPSAGTLILQALWDTVYPELDSPAKPDDPEAQSALEARLHALTLYVEPGEAQSPLAAEISGKTYAMTENAMGLRWLRFDFEGDECALTYENAQGEKRLRFGFGKNVFQKFPQEGYYGGRIGKPGGLYDCACSCAWLGADSLQLRVMIVDDYFGSALCHARFGQDGVTLMARKSAEWFLNEYQGFASGALAEA